MAGLNGETRPLLHHPRAHHSGRRRAAESWAPIVFGVCVMALVATTWVGTHRSINGLGESRAEASYIRLPGGAAPGGDAAAAAPAAAHRPSLAPLPGGGDGDGAGEAAGALAADEGALSAAAAAAALPDGDIELDAARVAAVVQRAKAAGAAGGGEGGDAAGAATQNEELFKAGGGGYLLGPIDGAEGAACPAGVASRLGAPQTALVVLAGSGSAGRLQRTMSELLATMRAAGEEVAGLFHIYIGVDGADPAVKKMAVHFAVQTMGVVRVLHHGKNATAAAAAAEAGLDEKCSNDPARPGHAVFLLRIFLECLGYPHLLVLGDSARLAPDALPYFAGAPWLLASDPSLWCLAGGSALGAAAAAADPALLLRTDGVAGPAEGLLMARAAGLGVLEHWRAAVKRGGKPPALADGAAGWQRFLLSAGLRRGRQCVVPELPRVRTAAAGDGADPAPSAPPPDDAAARGPPTPFELAAADAAGGSAAGAAAAPQPQPRAVDWLEADLSWLLEPHYSSVVLRKLVSARLDGASAARIVGPGRRPRRLRYGSLSDYGEVMAALGLPSDAASPPEPYCFPVPAAPLPPGESVAGGVAMREHCQDFLPPLSYRGVVPVYNSRGARMFVHPAAYDTALGGPADDGAAVGAAPDDDANLLASGAYDDGGSDDLGAAAAVEGAAAAAAPAADGQQQQQQQQQQPPPPQQQQQQPEPQPQPQQP
ncbi:hypothetical protein Rsub_03250 [Raphidocelis subcapitata]|uniref:Uncharacterized protein n=1 Tax=Raphidocelis subcapitata TaxID=307507 RepID=A0A2V0NYW6_9CHLO|nr:hypothetical protein Rsub_03250 [Raphidocelis subcapitata]|eukprot:GBF90117.1 hypothetical protein Rsub_03250 [Raphidocelis subcapitata]